MAGTEQSTSNDSALHGQLDTFRYAENNRPIAKGQCGSEEFENVILFSFELTLSGG